MKPRRWRILELWLILIFVPPGIMESKIFLLELLNASRVEQSAVQEAIGDINDELIVNGSSFILQLRNASKDTDLYNYTSSLASTDVIALLDFNVLPYYACTISTVTKIPVFRFHGSESFNLRTECNTITMSADYITYAQASIQILDTFKWKKIALMFQRSRFYQAAFFEDLTSNKDYTLSYIQLGPEEHNTKKKECSCTRAMGELDAAGSDVILLYTREKSSALTMEGCNPKKTYVWIIQDSISLDVISSRESHMVVGFELALDNGTKWNSKRVLLSLAYDFLLLVAMTLKKIRNDEAWLPGNSIATLVNKDTFYKHAKQMNIHGHTSTVWFDAKGRRVFDKLRISNLLNNTFIEVGQWSKPGNILTLTDRIHFNNVLLDGTLLKGRQISVVTTLIEPFVMRAVSKDSRATYYFGLCIDILNKLASDLKFTYKMKLADDGFYGAQINGKWNGMIRELIDGRAEMIVAPLTRDVDRQKYVTMTASFMYYTDNLMMKKTVIEERQLFQFMSPFSKSVWAVMGASLVTVALVTYILNYLSPYGYKNDQGTKTSEEFKLFNSIWFAAACMLMQGADHAPKAHSGRILAGFFWFSILVWVSTYTANLVAFFTVELYVKPVTNFQEAVESGYDLGVIKQSNLHSLFSNSEYDLYKRAWNRMRRLPKNNSQALQWMRTGRYIHILDGPLLDYLSHKKPCDLFTFPGLQSPRSYAFALRQNDPHVPEISLAILHLRENGFIENLRRKYWHGLNECPYKTTNRIKNKTIQLDSVTGMFLVLGMGFLVSLLTLAIEIYWHRAGRQRVNTLKENTTNNFEREWSQRVFCGEDKNATKVDSSDTTTDRHISERTA